MNPRYLHRTFKIWLGLMILESMYRVASGYVAALSVKSKPPCTFAVAPKIRDPVSMSRETFFPSIRTRKKTNRHA